MGDGMTFSDYTEAEINKTALIKLSVGQLRALQLVIEGDTFVPGTKLAVHLQESALQIDGAIDHARTSILSARFKSQPCTEGVTPADAMPSALDLNLDAADHQA